MSEKNDPIDPGTSRGSPPPQRTLAEVGLRLAATESEVLDMLGQIAAARGGARAMDAAWGREQREIARVLGKALGYPAADDGTICTGEHSALSLVTEAAGRIGVLTAEVERLRAGTAGLAPTEAAEVRIEVARLRDEVERLRAIEEHRGKAGI